MPNLQKSSNSQASNPKNRCRGERRAGRFWSLELAASLVLGVWNLEFFAWALSFSKIEMRLAVAGAQQGIALRLEFRLKLKAGLHQTLTQSLGHTVQIAAPSTRLEFPRRRCPGAFNL